MSILPVLNNTYYKKNSLPVKESPLSIISKYVSMPSYDTFEKTDSSVIFTDKTFQKAKDIVIQSILDENPKESMVFIMNDKLVYQAIGENTYVAPSKYALNLLDNPKNSIAILHSHPDLAEFGNYAPSLSFNDFNILILSKGAKNIYAINSKGEYAMLEKTDDTKVSKKRIERFEKLYNEELKKGNILFDSLQQEITDGMSIISENLFKGENIENLDEITQQINRKIEYANRVSVSREHNFWLNYAHMFDLKYDTDFSYFV